MPTNRDDSAMHRELNEAERTLVAQMNGHARDAAAEAGIPTAPGAPVTPGVLDQLWTGWDWSNISDEERQRVTVAFFGFAFGEYLAAQTGMQWRIVSDQHGDDYALVKPGTDATAFPLATVAKRLGEPAFFSAIAEALIREVAAVRGEGKPWWKVW